jgi:predicted nucleic acid-binding protein
MSGVIYADASALVKLVVEEADSPAMHRWFVEATRVLTSRVGVIETLRASARREHDPAHRERIVRDLEVIELDPAISIVAGSLLPPALRTLDAIHVASALALGPELDAFVTYDDRLAAAARDVGLPVARPAVG